MPCDWSAREGWVGHKQVPKWSVESAVGCGTISAQGPTTRISSRHLASNIVVAVKAFIAGCMILRVYVCNNYSSIGSSVYCKFP